MYNNTSTQLILPMYDLQIENSDPIDFCVKCKHLNIKNVIFFQLFSPFLSAMFFVGFLSLLRHYSFSPLCCVCREEIRAACKLQILLQSPVSIRSPPQTKILRNEADKKQTKLLQ